MQRSQFVETDLVGQQVGILEIDGFHAQQGEIPLVLLGRSNLPGHRGTRLQASYSLYYPSALFEADPPPENGGGLTLTSEDGRAKIVVFGVHNSEDLSPREYRRILLEEFGGYDRLDYSPVSKSWFVLSGYRGDNIYYQKVIFSCSNSVINVFSMTFPTADKPFYEGMIETMEDRFKTGRGDDTPAGC
jgi:hypothetical protein